MFWWWWICCKGNGLLFLPFGGQPPKLWLLKEERTTKEAMKVRETLTPKSLTVHVFHPLNHRGYRRSTNSLKTMKANVFKPLQYESYGKEGSKNVTNYGTWINNGSLKRKCSTTGASPKTMKVIVVKPLHFGNYGKNVPDRGKAKEVLTTVQGSLFVVSFFLWAQESA